MKYSAFHTQRFFSFLHIFLFMTQQLPASARNSSGCTYVAEQLCYSLASCSYVCQPQPAPFWVQHSNVETAGVAGQAIVTETCATASSTFVFIRPKVSGFRRSAWIGMFTLWNGLATALLSVLTRLQKLK